MAKEGKHVVFKDVAVEALGNGFFGRNLVETDGVELTYVTGDAGAGHDAHLHDDLDEILIFLEGGADFKLGDDSLAVRAGSLIYAPSGVPHGVRYTAPSKVLRLKMPQK